MPAAYPCHAAYLADFTSNFSQLKAVQYCTSYLPYRTEVYKYKYLPAACDSSFWTDGLVYFVYSKYKYPT